MRKIMTKADFTKKVSELFGNECVHNTDLNGHIVIKTNLRWNNSQSHVVSGTEPDNEIQTP